MLAVPAPLLRLARWVNAPARAKIIATIAIVAGTAWMLWPRLTMPAAYWLVDLQVYQGAGEVVRDGGRLYDFETPFPQLLPFTYPPFGGLLAVPLSLLERFTLGYVWTALEVAAVAWIARVLAIRVRRTTGSLAPSFVYAAAFLAVAWLGPVRDTFYYGQVNLFLLTLIAADLLVVRGRWPRGLLIGLAAAIKLTPAFFIPYLWITGRQRAAIVATITFVVAQLVAFVFIPTDSIQYWTSTIFEGERLGLNAGVANQSIRAMLLRFALPSGIGAILWLLLAIPVALLGLRTAKRAYEAGDGLLAAGVTGLTAALVSPVSWSHHFVWIALVITALIAPMRFGWSVPVRSRWLWAVGLYIGYTVHFPIIGGKWIAGEGSYVLGRLVQETILLLTLVVVCALPWRGHILASVDARVPRVRAEVRTIDGEAASNGRS